MNGDTTNHVDDEYDTLQKELAQLENALDLDDDDALFAMLDEIHERNVEELENMDEIDGKNSLDMIPSSLRQPPPEERFQDDVLEIVEEDDDESEIEDLDGIDDKDVSAVMPLKPPDGRIDVGGSPPVGGEQLEVITDLLEENESNDKEENNAEIFNRPEGTTVRRIRTIKQKVDGDRIGPAFGGILVAQVKKKVKGSSAAVGGDSVSKEEITPLKPLLGELSMKVPTPAPTLAVSLLGNEAEEKPAGITKTPATFVSTSTVPLTNFAAAKKDAKKKSKLTDLMRRVSAVPRPRSRRPSSEAGDQVVIHKKKKMEEDGMDREAKTSNFVSIDDTPTRAEELKREGKTFLPQALPMKPVQELSSALEWLRSNEAELDADDELSESLSVGRFKKIDGLMPKIEYGDEKTAAVGSALGWLRSKTEDDEGIVSSIEETENLGSALDWLRQQPDEHGHGDVAGDEEYQLDCVAVLDGEVEQPSERPPLPSREIRELAVEEVSSFDVFIPEEIVIILETATREASHKSKLRTETLKFLDTLHGYLVCRGKMDAKYAEIDEFQIIANHELKADVSEMLADKNDPFLYKSTYQQQSIHGISVKTLSELYEAAEQTQPIYQEIVHKAVQKLQTKHRDADVGVTVKLCELKGKQRAQEKAEDDYGKRRPRPGVSWLYDIVRGSVEFTSAHHVIEFLDLIQQEPSIRIVKAKNRFTEPSLTGYRDLNIQFQVDTSKGFHHTCELQIHHKAIKELDVQLNTHYFYVHLRSYFAGATASLEERLAVLKLISSGGAIDDSFLTELLETSDDVEKLERIGVLFRDQLCEYQWAFRVFVRLFDIRKARYGTRHPEVARSYNDIGLVLKDQGKLDEAMELYQESLKINQAIYDGDHLSVARIYLNMALVLKEQEKLAKSMDLFKRSLVIDIEVNGEQSFSVANTYNHMASVLRKEGKLDEAMDLFQKSLDTKRRSVGEIDSSVADTLQNIAIILKQQGRLQESENLFQESIDIATKSMGENHSAVAVGYRNLALVLEKQGELTGALELYRKSLDIYRKNVGEKHLLVADIYNDMAYSYKLQGDRRKAKMLLLKSMNIKKTVFNERVIEAGLRKKIANQRRGSHISPLTPRRVTT